MSLSCICPEPGDDPGDWWYWSPNDFSLFDGKRRKRCVSCNELIDIGSSCLRFERERYPYTDVERRIRGDAVSISPRYMCQNCGEIYLNLTEAGYCLFLNYGMREYLAEYWELTGFEPNNNGGVL
jgi:hypothetical protein